MLLALLFLLCEASFAFAQTVVLNEIYYDAPGGDGGVQFVELFNRSFQTASLAGYRLEAGDGASPDHWRLLWTGAAGDVIPPRGRFVVGEGNVVPRPDRVQITELENGPDAVRLVSPTGVRDVVGYGALTWAGAFEGRPAEDVPPGSSLARRIDGGDTDDNMTDFVALSPPTPGAANRPERDLALVDLQCDERVELGDVVTLHARLVNRGIGPLSAHEIEVLLWAAPRALETGARVVAGPLAADSLFARLDGPNDLDAGDSLDVALSFVPPSKGAWDAALQARTLDDGIAGNDRVTAQVQVGPGALIVHEVMSAPAGGVPEWVELRNVGNESVLVDGWTLEDATGHRATMHDGYAFEVPPDSFVVVCADPVALLGLYPSLQPRSVAPCIPWPALNNDGDRVVVRSPLGRVSDAMDLPGDDPPGASLERRSITSPSRDKGTWGASASAGGTPGRANSIDAGAFVPGVALIARSSPEGALLTYRTGFERAQVSLTVYDVRGRRVRALLEGADGPGRAGAFWDGRSDGGDRVAPGVYVAGLSALSGTSSVRARTCVVMR